MQEQQQERSGVWEATYEASIRAVLEGEVAELDESTRLAIWQQTGDGIGWSADQGERRENYCDDDLARFILNQYVLPAAERYSNARIRRFIQRHEQAD